MKYRERAFTESRGNKWYVTTDGDVVRRSKISDFEKYLTPYIHHGSLVVKANNKEYVLSVLVVKAFVPKIRTKRFHVGHKNEDRWDCSIDNLFIIPYQEHGRQTGWMANHQSVTVTNKDTGFRKRYRSIRSAAKALHVSYQTVLDYMNPKTRPKNSVLAKYIIRRSNRKGGDYDG